MYPPPPPPGAPPPMAPMGGAAAAQQVQSPALGLMIAAGIGLVFTLIGLAMNALGMGMGALGNLGENAPGGRYMHFLSGGVGIVFNIIALAVAGFIIWAAMQMKQLRNWNMSVAASVVAMIPCISPCCIIGLPVGIWALIVLMKPEVKGAFVG
jgi:hypothetical protein